jgi:hypothetical protein
VANLGNTFTAHPESRLPAPLAGNLCPVTFSSAGAFLMTECVFLEES